MVETRDDTSGSLALVLPGGGARAAYQVGVLAGLAERAGERLNFPVIVGVSAGAINAAALATREGSFAGAVRALEGAWLGLSVERVFGANPLALGATLARWLWMHVAGGAPQRLRVRGLLDTRPLRRTLVRQFDAGGLERNLAASRLRALALSATSYATGRTVTFVQAGSDVPTWQRAGRMARRAALDVDHVMASCALPLLFPAVRLGHTWYGDGSIRQLAPLAPAIHLGATRILGVSLRHGVTPASEVEKTPAGYPPTAQVLGMLLNAVFLDALEADAERLERINRSLLQSPAGFRHPHGLRPIELALVRPSRDLGRLAADLGHCLPRGLRLLVRGLGSGELAAPDLLSYLLFERPYIERLIELGRADAHSQWERIAPLFETGSGAAGAGSARQ